MPVFKRWTDTGDYTGYEIKITPTADDRPDRLVLILIDKPENDEEEGQGIDVLDPERVDTYENVISYSLSKAREELAGSVSVLLAAPNKPSRDSSLQVEAMHLIRELEPDAIILAGFGIAKALMGAEYGKQYGYMSHYPFEATAIDGTTLEYGCDALYTVPLFGWTDPDPPIKGDDGGGYVNLIGQVIYHVQTAVRGWNRHTIEVPRTLEITEVDTLDKFDAFYDALLNTQTPVFDTETDSLNRKTSKLLTMQWLLPGEPGEWYDIYFIPYSHKESPFLPDELEYIATKMRRYFESASSRYIVYHGGKFDVTQVINHFKLRWVNHRIYDTQSGEFYLDENIKFLTQVGVKSYALDAVERRYGYHRPSSIMDKEERGNMANQPLDTIALYGSIDIVTPYLIHLCQLAEAKRRGYHHYLRLVADQISMTLHCMASMEARGYAADASYLQAMTMPTSEVNVTIDAALVKFQESEAANRINDSMLKTRGWQAGGLFGAVEKPWLFNLNNQEIIQRLFFEELRLEPTGRSLKTGLPNIDDRFQEAYKVVPEVAWFTEWKKMSTIKSNFVDGLHNRLVTEPDCIADGRIRSSFDFKYVLTGRSSSRDPNFQNQPSQGPLAKLVKRVWIAPLGKLLIKTDYRAHEIRGLGLIGADPTIAKAFATADEALIRLRLATLETLDDAVKFFKENGDIHIINVKFFFNQVVDKSHVLRYQIKEVVFATVYGMAAFTLATNMTAKMRQKDPNAEVTKEDAQALIDKLFTTWFEAGQWIKGVHADGRENMVVFSPIGVPRHLYGYLHQSRKVQAAMDRRGPNSIIQGFSSNSGYTAGYHIAKEHWLTFASRGIDLGLAQVNTVHDSITNECNFAAVPIGLYLIEHGMTTLALEHYRNTYDFDITVPFNMDAEIGIHEAAMIEWGDQRFDSMAQHLTKAHEQAMTRQTELGMPEALRGRYPGHAETSGTLLGPGDLRNALSNLDKLAAIRSKELRTDPFNMLLRGRTEWFEQHCVGL